MNICIYTDNNEKDNNFESIRLRKNFKGFLEMNDESYVTQTFNTFYDVVQFFSINDVIVSDLILLKEKAKCGVTLFYSEGEANRNLLTEFDKNTNLYGISKINLDKINKFDFALVPTLKANEYAVIQGVNIPIYVVNPGIKTTKFDLKHSLIKDIAYRLSGFDTSSKIVVSFVRLDDKKAIERIKMVAKELPNIKFVVLSQSKNKVLFNKTKKEMGKHYKNVFFTDILEEDFYISLMYNADAFLNVNSMYSCSIECYEALISKCEIFTLNCSIFEDLFIDKDIAHNYNDLGNLIQGMKDYFSNKLESLKEKGFKYVKQFSLKKYGNELIKIYKSIEEVK